MKQNNTYHTAVLLQESVDALVTNPDGIYVDITFGGGGHSRAILEKLSPKGKLYAFDQDHDALKNAIDDPRFHLINQNFRYLKNALRVLGVKQIDGLLGDLGVSSHQFDTAERGFSTRFESDLDMRMNQKADISAKKIINTYTEEELANVFFHYGELKDSRRIAAKICLYRKKEKIHTTEQLKTIVLDEIPAFKQNKYLAQIFQALRIEVNDEIQTLKELLTQTAEVIKSEGTLVIISYHSLEDRLVKKYMKTGLFKGEPETDIYGKFETPFQIKTRKIIIPSTEEIEINNRARSAKLRIAIKNG